VVQHEHTPNRRADSVWVPSSFDPPTARRESAQFQVASVQVTVSKSLCPSHCVQVTVSKSLCPSHCVQVTVFKSLCSSHCVQVTVFKSPVFKSLCSSHRVQVTRTASTTRASTRNARTNWILTSTGSQEKSEGDKDDRQLHIKASIRARFTSHTTICFTDRVTK
jgi:hypothetical protein